MGNHPPLADKQTEVNKKAPEFNLKELGGKEITLSSFRGKVILLDFWATYCPPCREEMPSLQTLFDRLKKKNFVILAVNSEGDEERVKTFIKEKGYDFPVLLDADGSVASQYSVAFLPTAYIIDKSGNFKARVIGQADWASEEMIAKLEALMK